VAQRNIVVIGGSAGSIETLRTIVPTFSPDLPASVFIVIHTAPQSPGYLADILSRLGPLSVRYAKEGQLFKPGAIYLAPPDFHLILEPPNVTRVIRGPRENRTRPAVDPLFRSAALAFGPRVVGVVLSGGLDDGTAGLRGIKMCGGTTVVQDPADALVSSMPRSALLNVSIDYCASTRELGPLIETLARTPAVEDAMGDDEVKGKLRMEVDMAKGRGGVEVTTLGEPSVFTCPECHGTLLKLRGEHPLRFRCHTGHAFTADSLLADLSEATEEAIWNTIRSIQESSMLMTHLAEHWRTIDAETSEEFLRRAREAQARVELVRELASDHEAVSEEKLARKARQTSGS
jgi:two-component system, chemotaxis family, protein-glutamate methylesterase/glutaminase